MFFSAASNLTSQFTGKEWDESGLDNFLARYFSAPQGRFISPDLPLIDQSPGDPQSWNLYSYVTNDPLNNIDPTGRWECRIDGKPCPAPPNAWEPGSNTFDFFLKSLFGIQIAMAGGDPQISRPFQPPKLLPPPRVNDQVKRKIACSADSVVSFGLSAIVPGYAAVKTVAGAFDVNVNPIQAIFGYKPILSTGPALPSIAAGSSSGYWMYAQSAFGAAGGEARLDRLQGLASRTFSGAENAAKYGSEIKALQGLSKAALFAGRVTGVLSAISSGYDIYNCWAGN